MEEDFKSILEQYSIDRKAGQLNGTIPKWMTTGGFQTFAQKYCHDGSTVKDTFIRISKSAAKHMKDSDEWETKFFNLMWKGWLGLATPVLANMGTNKNLPVSCSGGYVADSIYDFYDSQLETAVLTKNGFGTSSYLSDIRPRGHKISAGGTSSGLLPIIKDFVQLSMDVSQGGVRRGAWAGYVNLNHPDVFEVLDLIEADNDGLNIGWLIDDEFIKKCDDGHKLARATWKRVMKAKAITGKGYLVMIDKINRARPECYVANNLYVKASNLCVEVSLHSDKDHTFTCVLSSFNLQYFDEWKDTDAIFEGTVFLDCVAQEFIELAKDIKGLEKAVRSTIKGRALGLGVLGYHTYLQSKKLPFDSFDTMMINNNIFRLIDKESERATRWLAEEYGEPEWCKGFGIHNTHRIAIAPTTTNALICGGVSQGIEPVVANIYTQPGSAGEIFRINPEFLKLMKKYNKNNKQTIKDIINNNGSCQHVDWLSSNEKEVFKTAFEIDQMSIIRQASQRQVHIDQMQSINLFFDADEDEKYITKIHEAAIKDPNILSLYYMRSQAGVQAAKDECKACE